MTDSSQQSPGRVAIVTGASRGIGATIATGLLNDGYQVASLDMTPDAPEGVFGVACNVTDSVQVDEAFKQVEDRLGPVGALVANAGITRDGLMMRMKDEDWQSVIDVNLTGAFNVIRRASRGMLRQRYGRIVLMASVVGMLGTAGQTNYGASKAGMIGLARSVARELGSRGVTCNVVAPGFIETAMTEVLDADTRKAYLAQVPLGRYGSTQDVADAVSFLCSDAASYISGAVIPVDGGLGMGH